MTGLLYEDLTYQIRGVVFQVYNILGFGHRESVYQKALGREFTKRKISFEAEPVLSIWYDGEKVGTYRPDFVVENKIIIEIKSADFLSQDREKQLVYYLKGTD